MPVQNPFVALTYHSEQIKREKRQDKVPSFKVLNIIYLGTRIESAYVKHYEGSTRECCVGDKS